jgi:hypothetical protein
MSLTVIATCLALAFVLLPVGLWFSVAGRRRACAVTVVLGLATAAVAIVGGFGHVDPAVGPALAFGPVVQAKFAIGLAMLHFAIGWVTMLARHRAPAASFGFIRTRAVARPRTIPGGFAPPTSARGPTTGPRLRPKTRTIAAPRPAAATEGGHPEASVSR